MDSSHHDLQGGIDDGAHGLGVKAVGQGGEAGRIGKEGGDDLALTSGSAAGLQGCSRGTDQLSEMGRSPANGGLGIGD
jgi:hypothetical protein